MFEKLLLEKIEELLRILPDREQEYKDYLEASKADISACHAGYFAQDNSDSDEAIANEVADILHNKKELISLRKKMVHSIQEDSCFLNGHLRKAGTILMFLQL